MTQAPTPTPAPTPAQPLRPFTCFDGYLHLQTGTLQDIAFTLKAARDADVEQRSALLVFDNSSGRTIDLDTRGTAAEVLRRLTQAFPDAMAHAQTHTGEHPPAESAESRGRGRPKLGVIAREVTLLPRHWEWLAAQPGGASVVLRKLVDSARHAGSEKEERRQATERAYHFMQTMAGDLPGFEEATRALFANDAEKFAAQIVDWPNDVREHAVLLAFDVQPSDCA